MESPGSWLMRQAADHELATGILILESVGPAIGRSRVYGPLDIDGHYFSAFLTTPLGPRAAGLHPGKGRVQRLVEFQLRGGPALEA